MTDAVTYSRANKGFTEKITGEDLKRCACISVNGEGGFALKRWLNGVEG